MDKYIIPDLINGKMKISDVKADDIIYYDTDLDNNDTVIIIAKDTTCWNCPHKINCKYAYDAYNTDGDCLIIK